MNQYERNLKARERCVELHGYRCVICTIDFEEQYGPIGKEYIHVHHTRPLGRLKKSYKVNPETDLIPVCPNCHAMLHRRDPPFDVEELSMVFAERQAENSKKPSG